jgi:hypothetical protein
VSTSKCVSPKHSKGISSPPTLSCRALARHPSLRSGRRSSSLRSGRRFGMSSRGTLPFLSSRGTQVPRDPSLRSGRQKRARGDSLPPCLPEARKCRGIPYFVRDGIKSRLRATEEGLAQKHFYFSPCLWLTKGGMGLKF